MNIILCWLFHGHKPRKRVGMTTHQYLFTYQCSRCLYEWTTWNWWKLR